MWITTHTGRHFHPLAPVPEDVCIEDIAHALSLKCRWTGHARTFYSVAEHAVRVACLLRAQGFGPREQLAGLLHDAGEAYLPDVASPIKDRILVDRCDRQRPGPPLRFRDHEACLLRVICDGLGLVGLDTEMLNAPVRYADLILLVTEARDLMHGTADWEWDPPRPLDERIEPLADWVQAKAMFMGEFQFLAPVGRPT